MARPSAARLGHRTGKWIVIVVATGTAGAIISLLFLITSANNNASTSGIDTHPPELAPLESLDQLAPVAIPPPGSAQTYNEAGELIEPINVDPFKTQVEQGIDDGSGMTYPCVSVPGTSNVCQRQLSAAEAKARGY